MQKDFTVAVTGDSIIRMRLSLCQNERFLSLIKPIREADASYTHLEVAIHDFDGPEVYPAAEGGHNWSQAPGYVVEELKWAGFDIVSTPSNHILDYSYGGLYSTWNALKAAGMPYAGTGMNLAEARAPGYLETPKGRVGLVSMVSSFVRWSRAGEARRDVKGRPGVNPLRFHHRIDRETAEILKKLAYKLGWRIYEKDDLLLFTQSGVENSITKYVVSDEPGAITLPDEQDLEGNLRSIRVARKQADYVIGHIHSHDFHPEGGISVPPHFVPPLAKQCIDNGADIFIAQGCHAPLRGIEIYNGKPIFYEPGDFLLSIPAHVQRLPADFYYRPGFNPNLAEEDGFMAIRHFDHSSLKNPSRHSPVGKACIVPVCTFGEGRKLKEIKLYPATFLEEPISQRGMPVMADAEMARKIIDRVAELSAPFGTQISFKDGIGLVKVG